MDIDLVRETDRWQIMQRRCVSEWSRIAPIVAGGVFPTTHALGQSFPDDAVYLAGQEA
jgi:hypothetical protein